MAKHHQTNESPARTSMPSEMAARLDAVIDRAVAQFREHFRKEIRRMFRFTNLKNVPAARIVLAEHGSPMHLDAVAEQLMAGGIWRKATGAKGSTGTAEIKRSLSQSARHMGPSLK